MSLVKKGRDQRFFAALKNDDEGVASNETDNIPRRDACPHLRSNYPFRIVTPINAALSFFSVSSGASSAI